MFVTLFYNTYEDLFINFIRYKKRNLIDRRLLSGTLDGVNYSIEYHINLKRGSLYTLPEGLVA